MNLNLIIHLFLVLLNLSIIIQSFENTVLKKDFFNIVIQLAKIILVLSLFVKISFLNCLLLLIFQFLSLNQFKGNLNGGSDALTSSTLISLVLMSFDLKLLQENVITIEQTSIIFKIGFYYLSIQVLLSYFIAGLVKAKEKNWWTGEALNIFFLESFYGNNKKILLKYVRFFSIFILIFELATPIIFVYPKLIIIYLLIATIFHFLNALIFGLHRFFWSWLCTYPIVYLFINNLWRLASP